MAPAPTMRDVSILGAPAEAQRSGFGGERSSGEMSEHCPQGEARDMKHGTTMTMGGMSRG